MFDFFIKRFLIINCTLSFNDNKHKLKILINIDAIDYAFINKKNRAICMQHVEYKIYIFIEIEIIN